MASGVDGKVVLTWGKVRSAAGYLVFQAEGKGLTKSEISKLKYKKAASTKNRKVILTGLRRGRMRWNKKTFSDPEGYRKMSADKVLADLFSER